MTTLYASPQGGPVEYEGRTVSTVTLGVAVNGATPGDVVQLTPGTYTKPIVIADGGIEGHPLILRGAPGVLLDGQTGKENGIGEFEPQDDDFAFIKLLTVDWVEIEGLEVRNCWPCAFFMRGVRDISVHGCTVTGSRFAIYARNKKSGIFSPGVKSKRIDIHNVRWIQDPEHEMWDGRITWPQVKDNSADGHSYFNGALFGSWDIRGDVTIRECQVSHAFNGIRMDCKDDRNLKRRRNLNVRIFNNRFDHIRDNAIEPETSAINWWIHHNEIHNCHAAFSMHNLSGGYWYVFSNSIWFDSQPGKPGQKNRGGKVFKFVADPYPQHPLYVIHNSFYIRSSYTKSGQTRHLRHYNNAIQFCFLGPYCSGDRKFFSGDDEYFIWHESYEFEQDMSNHPDYPDGFDPEFGYQISGIRTDQIFVGPSGGRLELVTDSPGRGAGRSIEVKLCDGSKQSFKAGSDIGAFQGSELFKGPDYVPLPCRIA